MCAPVVFATGVSMRQLLRFLGTTFVGGLLVILPVYLAIVLATIIGA